jgi:CO/xanthine dehydrogenase Mo-binding subunit
LSPGYVTDTSDGKSITLEEIARIMDPPARTADFNYTAPVSSESLTDDPILKLHGLPHLIFSYGVHLALVELDELTGKVTVQKYLAIHDCGNIINPQLFEQQIQGGITQGIGYALYENFIVDNGRIITGDLSTYILPGAMDICDIESVAIEISDEPGVAGMKGAGEISMNGPLPAIANAVADACGIRSYCSPITPESILMNLTALRKDNSC